MAIEEKVIELYCPHPNQLIIHDNIARFKIAVCGRRFGKTTLAINELIKQILLFDSALGWYIAPTYRQAKMIAWKMLFEYLPEELIKNKNEVELSVQLKTDGEICLKGADNPDSLRGVGLNYVVLDEYSQMKPEIWEEIIRPMLVDSGGGALFISTPKGKDHLYKMFLREKTDIDYKSFHFTSADNPIIAKEEIEKARQESSETYFKQEYLASFEDYEGLVWPGYDEKYHVIPEIKIPREWEKQYVMDLATTGTVVCLEYVTDFGGNIIFTNEYYGEHRLIQEHCQSILEMAKQTEISAWSCKYAFYETQINQSFEKFGTMTRLADLYREKGINLLETADTSDGGRQRVANLLYINPDKIHPFKTDLKGSPQIFLFARCKHTREQMAQYRQITIETATGIKTVPVKKNEHCCECVTRAVMALPDASKETEVISYDRFGRPNIGVYMQAMIEEAKRERAEKEYAESRMG